MVLLTLFFALKTDIVDFSADKILGGNFQILGENFPPEMPRIDTAFWTLKSGGDRPPPTPKSGGGPVPPSPRKLRLWEYPISTFVVVVLELTSTFKNFYIEILVLKVLLLGMYLYFILK
jgi:hypothetical protein